MSKRSALRRSREIVDKLEPEEEFFPLRGNDHASPIIIRMWAHARLMEIKMGIRPDSDRAQVTEGLAMATRMEIRLRDRDQKREHEATVFDDRGYPTTGAHSFVEHATTSGA